jgi:hypothetical protein
MIIVVCRAIQQLDYMRQVAARPSEKDPFVLDSSFELERTVHRCARLVLEEGLPPAHDEGQSGLSTMPRSVAQKAAEKHAFVTRLGMAVFGGLSLLIPKIIMVLVPKRNVSLITISVFVVGFVAAISWGSELKPGELLAAASAYTAVLVVFVGASLSAG